MHSDKTQRDSTAANRGNDDKTPPADRDQAPYSAPVAQDKADEAEFSRTTGAQKKPEADETLIARDNMKGGPARSGSS
jgi:hypothetical protein